MKEITEAYNERRTKALAFREHNKQDRIMLKDSQMETCNEMQVSRTSHGPLMRLAVRLMKVFSREFKLLRSKRLPVTIFIRLQASAYKAFFKSFCAAYHQRRLTFFFSSSNPTSVNDAQFFLRYFLLTKLSFRILFLLLSTTYTLHHRRDYDDQ